MPDPIPFSGYFCTDENIAVRDPGDFWELCPDSQSAAGGDDGVIVASNPWVLLSASTAFVGSVTPGMVVHLESDATPSPFAPEGDLLAVDSVAAGALTLRRIGSAGTGIGRPPVVVDADAVRFSILTFTPQISDATDDLMRIEGINDHRSWESSALIADLRELRQACVLKVLLWAYSSETRGKDGDWSAKLARCRADLDDVLGRVTVRFRSYGVIEPPRNRFQVKLVR